MLNVNFLKEKIATQNLALGIWSLTHSPMLIDVGAHAGLDFQILDMEHGVTDFTVLDNCIRACESMNCSPLVRVPGIQPSIIQTCLDMGAHGIIVPQIKSYEEALRVVQATHFPPEGSRGFNPFTRANGYNAQLPLKSTKLNNAFPLTSIIIETKEALADLKQILSIPGLDMLYIGIYDLSFALGLEGNVRDPALLDVINTSIKTIQAAGKLVSLMAKEQIEIQKYMELGVSVIVWDVDTNIYLSVIKNKVEQCKKLAKSRS